MQVWNSFIVYSTSHLLIVLQESFGLPKKDGGDSEGVGRELNKTCVLGLCCEANFREEIAARFDAGKEMGIPRGLQQKVHTAVSTQPESIATLMPVVQSQP